MKLNRYSTCFHDGRIFDITQSHDGIRHSVVISMESAQIHPEDMTDDLALSNFSTLKGKLHFEGLEGIYENHNPIPTLGTKGYDHGRISSLDILLHSVELLISWENYHPTNREGSDLFIYHVEAEKIYWENIPDLPIPFSEPIESYAKFLCGGRILRIVFDNENYFDRLEIAMESLPLTPEQKIYYHFQPSSKDTLKGSLLLEWVQSVTKDGYPYEKDKLSKLFDKGEILQFTIGEHSVLLYVKSRTPEKKTTLIEIKAGSIDWRDEPKFKIKGKRQG